MTIKQPNAAEYNPDTEYLRDLIDRITIRDLLFDGKPSQRRIAARLGIPERKFRKFLTAKAKTQEHAPYCVQYALEVLAELSKGKQS